MKLFEYIERFELIHKLIQEEKTGTPGEFARQLNISRSRLYEVLDEMKSRGFPISYSRNLKSFYYEYEVECNIEFNIKLLTDKESKKNYGGSGILSEKILFLQTEYRYLCP